MFRALASTVVTVVLSALSGCAMIMPPMSEGLTLSVKSYDASTGAYVVELRNNTPHPAIYEGGYLSFHVAPSGDPKHYVGPMSNDEPLLTWDHPLDGNSVATLTGRCTAEFHCPGANAYAGLRACWGQRRHCEKWYPVWTQEPLGKVGR